MVEARSAEQVREDAVQEVLRRAPVYKFRPNPFYLLFCLAALAACLLPAFISFPFDWAAMYFGPIVLFIGMAANYNGITERTGTHYQEQLRPEVQARFGKSDVSVDEVLNIVWRRRQLTPQYLGILYLVVASLSIGGHFWYLFGDVVLSQLVTVAAWLGFIGRILLFILGILIALVCAVSVVMAIWADTKTPLEQLRQAAFGPLWNVDPTEANLLEIIDHDVDLRTMLRRVDNYTLESTLLGALAFSAFVTILIESGQPIGDLSWVLSYVFEPRTFTLFDYTLTIPVAANFVELTKQHIGSAVGAFLLSGAVSFLAVLVARIQFTDAYRHAEKLLSKAQKLNDVERTLAHDRERVVHYTRQVSALLMELAEACKRIAPIINFMRGFRTLGLWLFVFATAICGLYFSTIFMVLIFVLFVTSFLYFVFYERFTMGAIVKRIRFLGYFLPSVNERDASA